MNLNSVDGGELTAAGTSGYRSRIKRIGGEFGGEKQADPNIG